MHGIDFLFDQALICLHIQPAT